MLYITFLYFLFFKNPSKNKNYSFLIKETILIVSFFFFKKKCFSQFYSLQQLLIKKITSYFPHFVGLLGNSDIVLKQKKNFSKTFFLQQKKIRKFFKKISSNFHRFFTKNYQNLQNRQKSP